MVFTMRASGGSGKNANDGISRSITRPRVASYYSQLFVPLVQPNVLEFPSVMKPMYICKKQVFKHHTKTHGIIMLITSYLHHGTKIVPQFRQVKCIMQGKKTRESTCKYAIDYICA